MKIPKHLQDAQKVLKRIKRRESDIKAMVDAFLAWPLPESVCSDKCASVPGYPHRTGTNLLTAAEAKEMFEYVLLKTKAERRGKK